ncbi:MAG: metal-dependent hydrolase [Rhodospirillaceae bacterium]|nr:metal-dependent hydrolase [Rhodospirillaceae bacterium]MBT5299926.1 metal-dependent hydrolase [Rhodospirillaceae bacterium]MBT5513088.1 metal-dependent hydrolase [Rhodospirillaceae bacterium]MBT6087468.1 metal-dependent hydrolase [Rhodospirillaceae bacterium]MBT6607711.1 metal-dependent hydrolase [Rhodospirillaceae bacterium]
MLRKLSYAAAGLAMLATMSAEKAIAADVLWYGQAVFKITSPKGKVIMIDPFISKNPNTPKALKDISKIGKIDMILVTHGHGDHVGDTVALAKQSGAKVLINADMGRTFASLGWLGYKQMIRFNKSGPVKPAEGITVTMVRAEHSSEVRSKDKDGKETMHPGGEPAGYTIYHAGDTGVFADMKFIGEYYKPDLALLPIGGHFTMDPAHAAYAVKNLLKTKTVMPMHYGTFKPLKGTPAQFKAALGDFPTNVVVMQPGDSRKFGG